MRDMPAMSFPDFACARSGLRPRYARQNRRSTL